MTIVEVIVAIAITGVAATGLAGMAYWAGRTSLASSLATTRQAALTSLAGRLSTIPYGELTRSAGCTQIGGMEQTGYTRCVRVETIRPGLAQVTVIVMPNRETVAPDSVVFERSISSASSPF